MGPKHHQKKLLLASTFLTLLNFAAIPLSGCSARSPSPSPSRPPFFSPKPMASFLSPGPSPEGESASPPSPPYDISPSDADSPASPIRAPIPASDLSPSIAYPPISSTEAPTATSDISPSIAYPPSSPIQSPTPAYDLSPSIAFPPASSIEAPTPAYDLSPSIAYPPTSPLQAPTPAYDVSPSDAYSPAYGPSSSETDSVDSPTQSPSPTYDLSPSDSVPESSPAEAPSSFAKSLNALFQSPISEILKNPDAMENPEVKRICNSTDYPGLCMSSISPFFNGKADPISILEMSINATIHLTNFAITAATKLATGPNTPPKISTGLEDCSDFYDDALSNLQSALDAIPQRDINTINSLLNAALVDYGTCDEGFTQRNPLGNYDDKLTMMANNCLAIVSLVK